jgi:branched-chain amino acid transport system substrate-binding protein
MFRRKLGFGLVVLLVLTMSVSVFAEEEKWEWEPAPKVIEIGAVDPFTGKSALAGELLRRGMEIALERINEAGGINGIPLKPAYEDSKGTQDGAVAAMTKLLYEKKVIVTLASQYSNQAHAISHVLNEAECPGITGGSAWSLRELKNPWLFGSRTCDKYNGGMVAKFLVEEMGHTKIAAIYSDEAFGQGGFEQISKALKDNYGVEVTNPQKFAQGTKDFTAQLLSLKKSGAPCAFLWSTNATDGAILLRQMKQLGVDVDMLANPVMGSQTVALTIAPEEAEGLHVILDYTPVAEGKWSQYLNEECLKRYKQGADSDIQWAHDTCMIIAEAFKRAGVVRVHNGEKQIMPVKQARKAIREALLTIRDFDEGTTRMYSIDENQDFSHTASIVRIHDGKHEFVKFVQYTPN